MLPILIGLIAGTLFGIGAYALYGLDALVDYSWIDTVFWSLIGAGAAVSVIDGTNECLRCRISRRIGRARWSKRWCATAPCGPS
jgi:hypothetical protein